MLPSRAQMYRAMAERDSSFEGIFFAGVKTTGVFCRPTCRARKPKPENVSFFATTKAALDAGFRPCKVCRPMEPAGKTPEGIERAIAALHADPRARIRDSKLRELGLSPSLVRRWFLKNHGMTFQGFQRALRIGSAYGRIIHGERVAVAAFDHGYKSLSGFGHSFKKQCGHSPSNGTAKNIIRLTRFSTPLGLMVAGAVDEGVCLLEFADRKMLETELARRGGLRRHLKAEIVPGQSKHFDLLQNELKKYFDGTLKAFTAPVLAPGSPFQQKVWNGLRRIPYGTTRSYREQARFLDMPEAVRAVARANGANRISIIIPCHRVIGSDGKLVGYGGGLWRKKYLLDLERKSAEN
ncbi:MAG: methylated-DNA--[protein]-cysteine S-methyltransferase [Candidatus Edwardsbacteria bacterium]|nr:methylated-DNA--[protein]-cysteine S-methyltransferase [Candidatus Edwardsbacteria bacterium]